jgi:hypothetical protein
MMPNEQVLICVTHRIDAAAERTWSYVGNFGEARLGIGFVDHGEIAGEGVGALRTLHFSPEFAGGRVVERQAARDEAGYYYAYEMADSGSLPFTDYRGSVHVIPLDLDEGLVVFTNRYRVAVELRDAMQRQSLALLEILEANLKRLVAAAGD